MNVMAHRSMPLTTSDAWAGGLIVPATVAGALCGMAYALSPLTTVLMFALAALLWWALRGVTGRERRWTLALLVGSLVVRAAAIGAIALTADPQRGSFRSIYGDGQYALERAIWLSNTLRGIPIAPLDFAEAFNDYGRSIYYYPLAWLQVVFGPAPYALHLTSVVWYFAGAIALYRLVRTNYGTAAGFGGLALTLCLPTLLLWSMAPLKESLYFSMASLAVVSTARIVRARRRTTAAGAAVILVLAVVVATGLRTGGLAMTVGGLACGLAIAAVVTHRRLALAAIVCVPIAAALGLAQNRVQQMITTQVRRGVVSHIGFVMTGGSNYRLLEFDFYNLKRHPYSLTRTESINYLAGAFRDFVLIPKPWAPNTRNDIAMVPQQLVWYALVIFSVPGLIAGLRRDALLTGLLAGTVLVGTAAIAPASGNVGTLIRHRDMIVPFLAYLGTLGVIVTINACATLVRKEGQ